MVPSEADLERSGELLAQAMALAERLPTEHAATLSFPRLAARDRH